MRLLLFALLAAPALAADPAAAAVAFLAREVPAWQSENHCFSCHNNGDGARALLLARARGRAVPSGALADSLSWLRRPEAWEKAANPAFSDVKLARIQFSAALAEAVRDGLSTARPDLARAAEALLPLQDSSGAWKIDTGGVAGAAATYGATLATYQARRVLETAGPRRYQAAILGANRWLETSTPENVLDRAALLLALPETASRHLAPLLTAQNGDGGWGPQFHAPSEAFDTAIVLLALDSVHEGGGAISRGRAFLARFQLADGSWPETTRPSGLTSYAERISTAAWALCALLAGDGK